MCLMLACKIRAIQRHVLAPESYNSASKEAHGGLAHLHHPPHEQIGENQGIDWLYLSKFHSFCIPLTNETPWSHRKTTLEFSPGQRYELLAGLDHGYSVYQYVCGRREAKLYR
jgi:hypothetical protein